MRGLNSFANNTLRMTVLSNRDARVYPPPEDVGLKRQDVVRGLLPPALADLGEGGADVQACRPELLRSAAQVEADLLQLESERAIDRVGSVVPASAARG